MRQLNFLEGYTPSDFGLDKWERYRTDPVSGREVQLEIIEFLAYSDKRFRAACAPTGSGKSLIALSLAKLSNYRTIILTSTLGLQQQYMHDGEQYGLVNIQGKTNYKCAYFPNPQRPDIDANCKDGAHLGCRFTKGKGCSYETAKRAARNAELVAANYAYWLNVNDKAMGLTRTDEEAEVEGENPFDLLILDEAHNAPNILADYLSMRVYEKEIERFTDAEGFGEDVEEWKALANNSLPELKKELVTTQQEVALLGSRVKQEHIDVMHRLERTVEKFGRISTLEPEEWVLEKQIGTRSGRVWDFDVIWPGRYAEQYLFCGVPNVILMSATVRQKTLSLLGIRNEDADFQEWNRIFPPNRNPIYSIPATYEGKEVRVERKSSEEQLRAWVEHIDQIIDGRLDRKGIIQTVSYSRQQYFMEHSRHSKLMLGNTNEPDSERAQEVAEKFKKAQAPALLVSPSFSTGWDFPDSECEYIILCKIPFVPAHTRIMKAREARDKLYGFAQTMTELVQSAGRGMRRPDDRCEVFIVDGHLNWFLYQNRALAPDWFVKAVRKVNDIPEAPEKL